MNSFGNSTYIVLEMPSYVWKYFSKTNDPKKARCDIKNCGQIKSYASGVKGLAYHLQADHAILNPENKSKSAQPNLQAPVTESKIEEIPQSSRQKPITDFFVYRSLEEAVAKLAAESGLTFHQIAKTKLIQEALKNKFPNRSIPSYPDGVKRMVMSYYNAARLEVKKNLKALKEKNKKFSVTLDEWTSCANKRYLNINVHFTVDGNTTQFMLHV